MVSLKVSSLRGYDFVGLENLRNDLYPAIDVSETPSLQQPGKVVLITGAGRGVGRSMAIQYAHAKVSTIIICARTASELDKVANQVKEANNAADVQKQVLSVTDGAAIKKLARRISNELGRLDILINNAGVMRPWESLGDTDLEENWQVVEVNLHGPLLLTHAFLPLLGRTAETQPTHVNIVNLTSIGAVDATPGSSSYSISKLALQRLTEFVSIEYGRKGVNVVGMHPGAVRTKLADEVAKLKDFLTDGPDLCDGCVVWLSSREKGWLNGRFVSATWNVETLEGMRKEIEEGDKLKMKLIIQEVFSS